MTSHHVAWVVAELRNFGSGDTLAFVNTSKLAIAATILEHQAKALSEAEAEVDRLTKRLDLLAVGFGVPDGGKYIADWQTRIAKYKSAFAAEDRLAEFKTEAMKVIDELVADLSAEIEGRYAGIKHYPSEARRYARDIAPVVAARAFTNSAKEKT